MLSGFNFGTINTFTADNSTPGQLDIEVDVTGDPSDFATVISPVVSISVAEGVNLAISFSTTGADDVVAQLYRCDDLTTPVQTDFSPAPSGTLNLTAIPAGEYILVLISGGLPAPIVASFSIVADDTMVVNPVSVAYDDSGTTRFIEACPKLLIPFGTEASGDWYADSTAAQDAIDAGASNCVGFELVGLYVPGTNFVATDGGSSLNIFGDIATADAGNNVMVGCVNAEKGETISIAYSITASGYFAVSSDIVAINVYDQDGVLFNQQFALFDASTGGTSGTFVTPSLPAAGKYTVLCSRSHLSGATGAGTVQDDFTITSSGALTVNPLQALFDRGVACPARLDCS